MKALSFALLTVVIVKAFLFWVYVVPSSSMEKTLLPGDLIFVNKMAYGVRSPITPLTVPLSHHKMPFNNLVNSFSDLIQLPYFRFFKAAVQRNDVVVFNYPRSSELPIDHRPFYIKRCIGLPGDTLQIKNKEVFINGGKTAFPENVTFNYKVHSNIALSSDTLLKYNITEGGRVGGKGFYQLTLSNKAKEDLLKTTYINTIKPLKVDPSGYADYIFPFHKNYQWNIDYFGEVFIPKRGQQVALNTVNIQLYKRIIETYECNKIEIDGNTILINNEVATTYTFKMNYYFMMGDNRQNSSDSRFWGFLPEDHIVGKASFIVLSVNKNQIWPDKYRWNRFFKELK